MNTLLSLFDASGEWSKPFQQAGWSVILVDLVHGIDIYDFEKKLDHINRRINGVLAAPPSNDFTVSGSQYWIAKDASGVTKQSVDLVECALRIIRVVKPDFWAIDNPVGRIASLIPDVGEPRFQFDPYEFARWTDPSPSDIKRLLELQEKPGQIHHADIELVKRTNCYRKRTVIYGDCNVPEKRPLFDVPLSKQGSWVMRSGGKSRETKAERSVTPAGFARAFAAANIPLAGRGYEKPYSLDLT